MDLEYWLTLFGFHIYLLGSLMKRSRDIPKTIWMITYFAGISYVILHLLKLWNQQSEWVTIVEMVLALPMALGELGLAVWLLFKGGRSKL